MDEKKYDESIKDFDKAIELKPDYAIAYFNRAMAEYFSDKKDKACMDFQKSAGLGFQPASDFYNRNCK
jgi:lipoprotein NlpI